MSGWSKEEAERLCGEAERDDAEYMAPCGTRYTTDDFAGFQRHREPKIVVQLRSAMAEIERVTADRDAWRCKAEIVLNLQDLANEEVKAMRPVVEAAERYRDNGACYAGIFPAVDTYRARKP